MILLHMHIIGTYLCSLESISICFYLLLLYPGPCFPMQPCLPLQIHADHLELQNHKLDVVKVLPCATVTYITLSIQIIVARAPIKHVAPQAAIHCRAKYCCNTIMDYTFFLVH